MEGLQVEILENLHHSEGLGGENSLTYRLVIQMPCGCP